VQRRASREADGSEYDFACAAVGAMTRLPWLLPCLVLFAGVIGAAYTNWVTDPTALGAGSGYKSVVANLDRLYRDGSQDELTDRKYFLAVCREPFGAGTHDLAAAGFQGSVNSSLEGPTLICPDLK
jgi:hypothetical protein